jgi:hypothetical protein
LFYKLADHHRFTDLSVELREAQKMYFWAQGNGYIERIRHPALFSISASETSVKVEMKLINTSAPEDTSL